MYKTVIEFKDVNLQFNNHYILKNFNLLINKSDKVIVKGRSGIGKTTLFNLILGFVRPDSGSIFFNQDKVTAKSAWEIRRHIAYIAQDTVFGRGIVKDIISNILNYKANSSIQYNEDKLHTLCANFRIEKSLLTEDIENISGGERQRIAIIIALLLERKTFLMDEATSALDDELKKIITEYFCLNSGFTLVIISHDDVWYQQADIKTYNFEEHKWVR